MSAGLGFLISNLIFPPKCVNCGELLDVELTKLVSDPFCPKCRLHFERAKNDECERCGLEMKFCRCMPQAMNKVQCTSLLKLMGYKNRDNSMPMRRFVYSLKCSSIKMRNAFIAEQMRELLIPEMRAYGLMPSDCVITYLPRSRKNKALFGLDQSLILARSLSKITGIKFLPCFKRRLFTTEQKNLNKYERILNMRSAYELRELGDEIRDKTLILVDDVVTTGASMAACARLAYSGGAYAVMGICLAKTEKSEK